MGILVRFRGTELNGGSLVHYPGATSYTVMQDNTVELRDGCRSVGAIHSDRWESLELIECDNAQGEDWLSGSEPA